MVFAISPANVDGGAAKQAREEGSSWKQWILTFICTITYFTAALQHSYLLRIPDHPPYWIRSALLIGTTVSLLPFSFLSDRLGRKAVLVIASSVQLISWIPILFDTKSITVIISSSLIGISNGGLFSTTPIYILEISDKRHRGTAVTSLVSMTSLGLVIARAMTLVNESFVLYLTMLVVVVQMVLLLALVETPCFYLKKGNVEMALESFANLKRLNPEEQYVKESISGLIKEGDTAKANGHINIFSLFKNQIWRDLLRICLAIQTFWVIGGRIVFLDHLKVFQQAGVVVDHTWGLYSTVVMLLGAILAVGFVDLLERKYLLALSHSVASVSLGTLAVFMQSDMKATHLTWAPKACLLVILLSYGMSCGLTLVLCCEVFNYEIRAKIMGILLTYAYILDIIHFHSFTYIEDQAGIHCIFYIFAIINLIGVVYSLFFVPNTRRKSCREIEKQIKKRPILK